jgi:hypothetical protein
MSRRKGSPLDPEDVLSDRVKPTAAELLQLIHRENPTGRELPAREAEIRYARKARLQSLLVRRFADELDVAADPALPGTISLRHRGHGRDACHAVLAALDDDARSWAQRELDLAAPATTDVPVSAARPSARSAATEAGDDDATPEEMARLAEAAVASYDYERARDLLGRAVDATGGASTPAAALLALLVDTLGDDAGALAIEARLAREALADGKVRGPLALAAARSGQEERALRMARGLEDAPVAAIFTALATSALTAGHVERAAAHVEQARRHDPTSPGVTTTAGEIAKARAKECGPAEAEIAAFLEAGRDIDAEKRAREVLARWPESAPARRALRDIEERRRAAESARLSAEAEELVACGDAPAALARLALASAVAHGAARDAIERRARDIEAAARARREMDRVDHVIQTLDAADLREGLSAYTALDEALRARVRARSSRQELAWIDRMAGVHRRDRTGVDAAIAIAEARAALALDPEAAIALLKPHKAALEGVPEARRIAREAAAEVRALRLARTRAAVDAARAELAAGHADEALARLGTVNLRELSEEERAEVTAIEAAATRSIDRGWRGDEARRLRAAERLFEAHALAEELAASTDDAHQRAQWDRERDEIRVEIQRRFQVEVDDEPRSPEELGRFRPYADSSDLAWLLTSDGRGIVFARAFERWVIVRVLERATMRVRPTVLLRTPEPLVRVQAMVSGPTLWLTGERGALVEIAMDRWEVRDFRAAADVSAPGDVVETALVVASEDPKARRHFWVASRTRSMSFPERLRIIDLAQRRVVRELGELWRATAIAGLGEPLVATLKDQKCTVYTARGVVAPHGRLEPKLSVLDLAVHPTGKGFVALMTEPSPDGFDEEEDFDRSLYLATITPSGDFVDLAKLPDADPDRPSGVAAALGGCIHAIASERATSLFTFVSDADYKLRALSAVEVGSETTLVQDAGARRIVALTVHDDGVDAVELGRALPDLPARQPRRRVVSPSAYDMLFCDQPTGERNAAALALAAAWQGRSDADIARQIREIEQGVTSTPERLIEALFALRLQFSSTRQGEAGRVYQALAARFPDHPEVRMLQANRLAQEGKWSRVSEALAGVSPDDFDQSRTQHLHHLRALVALHEGRFSEADDETAAALMLQGRCELASLTTLIAAGTQPIYADAAGLSPLAELVIAIRQADACVAALDVSGARRALDTPLVSNALELQSLARLADILLAHESALRAERVHAISALGTLVDRVDTSRASLRLEVPVPGAWSAERITEVTARARAWLDVQGLYAISRRDIHAVCLAPNHGR